MFETVEINNFRALRRFKLEDTRHFNLLVGPNNTGKTSVLEALCIHSNPLNLNTLGNVIAGREDIVHADGGNGLEQIKWLFSVIGKQHQSLLSIKGKWLGRLHETSIELSVKNPSLFAAGNTSKLLPGGITLGSMTLCHVKNEGPPAIATIPFITGKPLVSEDPPSATMPGILFGSTMKSTANVRTRLYNNAVLAGFDGECLVKIKELDSSILDIRILPSLNEEFDLFVHHQQIGFTSLTNFGGGLQKIYLLLLSLASCKNGILLIDELESAIHVSALNNFLDWLIRFSKQLNVQIFATTHSLECLDAVLYNDQLETNELSIFRLHRKGEEIACQQVEEEMAKNIRGDLGADLRF